MCPPVSEIRTSRFGKMGSNAQGKVQIEFLLPQCHIAAPRANQCCRSTEEPKGRRGAQRATSGAVRPNSGMLRPVLLPLAPSLYSALAAALCPPAPWGAARATGTDTWCVNQTSAACEGNGPVGSREEAGNCNQLQSELLSNGEEGGSREEAVQTRLVDGGEGDRPSPSLLRRRRDRRRRQRGSL